MKLENIIWSNVEPTPAIEEYVQTRIQKLSKIVQNMESATMHVEIGKPLLRRKREGEVFYVEFTASIQGVDFHTSARHPSVFRALEKTRNDMHQKIMRWKNKERSTQRKQGAITKRLLRSGTLYK